MYFSGKLVMSPEDVEHCIGEKMYAKCNKEHEYRDGSIINTKVSFDEFIGDTKVISNNKVIDNYKIENAKSILFNSKYVKEILKLSSDKGKMVNTIMKKYIDSNNNIGVSIYFELEEK